MKIIRLGELLSKIKDYIPQYVYDILGDIEGDIYKNLVQVNDLNTKSFTGELSCLTNDPEGFFGFDFDTYEEFVPNFTEKDIIHDSLQDIAGAYEADGKAIIVILYAMSFGVLKEDPTPCMVYIC